MLICQRKSNIQKKNVAFMLICQRKSNDLFFLNSFIFFSDDSIIREVKLSLDIFYLFIYFSHMFLIRDVSIILLQS